MHSPVKGRGEGGVLGAGRGGTRIGWDGGQGKGIGFRARKASCRTLQFGPMECMHHEAVAPQPPATEAARLG